MIKTIDIVVSPQTAVSLQHLKQYISKHTDTNFNNIQHVNILKRSIDGRAKDPRINLKVDVFIDEPFVEQPITFEYPDVSSAKSVVVIGAGPAGLFASLKLIQLGLKPILLERGRNVKERKHDIASIYKENKINEESNYCFGEGGAGTYSDGKLYTRSNKRGDVDYILKTLVFHGAEKDILIDTHAHIGTDKLPHIIAQMRESILNAGGEVHFNQTVTDIIFKDNSVVKVIANGDKEYHVNNLILATGHSARDIYKILHDKKVIIEPKPFALGVRVEHPQVLIDSIQYHRKNRGEFLPAASYSLVHQVRDRGVYSFCMCPGGIIVPASTENDKLVVNGMSNSRRNSPYANSGLVVSVELADLKKYSKHGVFAGIEFQSEIEHKSYVAGGKTQHAPAQRITDFVIGKNSNTLPSSSYLPGLVSTNLDTILPDFIASRLKEALFVFDKKLKGYFTDEAIFVAVESRTSSAIKIPRDPISLAHVQVQNLYPCGEGAGHAGGIVSSALDGVNCAVKIAEKLGVVN